MSPFLAGGGEMGERMRAFDWSRTGLGPPENWPQSLKTSVSTCLNSRFAILIWWGKDLIKLYNDAYTQILGRKHPAALGAPGREVWPEIWHIIAPMLEGVLARGEATWSDNLLLELERKGYPEECYFTFSYSPILDESGRVGGVFTPVQETTAQVIGERRLRTLRDLAESARAANATTGEEICQAAARVLAGNPLDMPFAAFYLFSKDGGEARLAGAAGILPGAPLFPEVVKLDAWKPEVADWPFASAARRGQFEIVRLPRRLEAIPSGDWTLPPAEAAVLPVASPGQRNGFLVVALSPRKRLDEEYRGFLSMVAGHVTTALADARSLAEERKRAEALEELDRAKTQFFSNVSHEFRTPLTLMLGPIEGLLARTDEDSREIRAELALVHRNALRLHKLVNALLDFSRIEAGRMEASYEPLDLSRLTADIASTFRSAIENAGVRFHVDCPPLSQAVYVDREMWEKIVLNLLSNAFKYTFQGEIRVGIAETGGCAVLSVRDTGTGIEASELPHIFERFRRVRNARGRTFEGTGIGLALTAELVNLHGGSVTAESVAGEGSTFLVSIPFGAEHLPPAMTVKPETGARPVATPHAYLEEALPWMPEEAQNLSGGTENVRREGRLLLADDNADMRGYVRRVLADHYEIEAVTNGSEALDAAHRSLPDLILSDVMMPELDGVELVRALRSSPATASIPVILLSARSGEESRVEGMDAGADDYLVKPFTARELRARVGAHLKLARARKEAEAQSTRILESITDGFCALDSEWRFVYLNRAAEKILAVSRQQIVGKSHWDLFPEMAGTVVETEYRRAVREEAPVEFENFVESLGMWLAVRAYPRADGGLSVYFRDVTERKRSEAALRRLNEDLKQFTFAATHDIREPLRMITIYVQLLQRSFRDQLDAQAAEFIDQILNGARRISRLIDGLLQFSRVGEAEDHKASPVDADDALRGALENLQIVIREAKANIIHDRLPTVLADPAHVGQVFQNLIENGLKYSAPGRPPAIRIFARRDGSLWIFSVQDNGIGVATEHQEKIFLPFKRLHGSEISGAGIGLATCRRIVERYGGRIWLESKEGEGCTFSFSLPAAAEPASLS